MQSNSQRTSALIERSVCITLYVQADHADKSTQVLEMTPDISPAAARTGPPAPLHYPECFGAFATLLSGLKSELVCPASAVRTSSLRRVCHVNNKCTQCGDLPWAAGLWCILILLHVSLYYSPSFIWIKEEEFKNGQCGTIGIQIASIYCAEWWSGCPLCPSPS